MSARAAHPTGGEHSTGGALRPLCKNLGRPARGSRRIQQQAP